MTPSAVEQRARALAALRGLAIGDALGMPTQMMSRTAIAARYGAVTGFLPADADHPLAAGMPAGSITDDTEQALLLARLLVAGHGHVDPTAFAAALVAWEDDMRARGSLDLLGPSTKRAVEAVLAGEPVETAGRYGTTNGAAMRVTPVGIARSAGDLPALIDLVVEASSVTHHTGVALAGASAVAAAVSTGVSGGDLGAAIARGAEAAELAASRGYWVAAADVASRIRWAVTLADPADAAASLDRIVRLVGTSLNTQESVPAAFGILATYANSDGGADAWAAVCAAASLGGDSDTVAAMVGAIAGATGGTFPAEAIATVESVNHLDLASVVDELLALR